MREIPGGFLSANTPDFEAAPCPHFADVRPASTYRFPHPMRSTLQPPPPRPVRKMALVPFFSYPQLLPSSRACLTCSLTILVSSRSCARWPPVQALRPTRSLPSTDLGPVDCFHGFHSLIDSACLALRSNDHPLTMICLQ